MTALLHWVTETAAGLPQPGLAESVHEDLSTLQRAEIRLLISLTEKAIFSVAQLERYGLTGRHFPIGALGIPEIASCVILCDDVASFVAGGSKVAFHCWAGLGRTGTMLACHLVWSGMDARSAIAKVRLAIPGAIETSEQAELAYRLARERVARAQKTGSRSMDTK